jgi:hypothetical protein
LAVRAAILVAPIAAVSVIVVAWVIAAARETVAA